ncbi:virion core protein [Nile crocodilepox virus]|uniref:Virion core protein n=1 Tax=Nile crocodilepox virus (isolate Crocodylus niloticus/Zimbabwe/Ume/2001) TaxID=1289473 RepID=Q070A0_CPRVZ|nr:virion core protein [Nile crocodilepox virus]ABJ09042.1 virion core protein [Nile crocodilepox virus]
MNGHDIDERALMNLVENLVGGNEEYNDIAKMFSQLINEINTKILELNKKNLKRTPVDQGNAAPPVRDASAS